MRVRNYNIKPNYEGIATLAVVVGFIVALTGIGGIHVELFGPPVIQVTDEPVQPTQPVPIYVLPVIGLMSILIAAMGMLVLLIVAMLLLVIGGALVDIEKAGTPKED